MMGGRHRGPLRPGSPNRCRCGAMVVEGSMTQGAGQGPEVVRTATLRDFRVPGYVHETGPYAQNTPQGESAGPVGESGRYAPGESNPYMSSEPPPPSEFPGEFS